MKNRRVCPLMIVLCLRVRQQNGRNPGAGQFRQRGGSGASHRQVRDPVTLRQIPEERFDFVTCFQSGVCVSDRPGFGRPRLVHDVPSGQLDR